MEQVGAKLRAVRQKWGLTLREVEERSSRLAQEWGKDSCRISASWLDRVEREGRGLSFSKFIVLAVIYSIPPEQLLAYCPPASNGDQIPDNTSGPNTTLLLTKGPLEEHARRWLPDSIALDPTPDATSLLSQETYLPSHYRRGIIGRLDRTLDPMIRPGSIVLINTQRRAIAHRREWTNEFDRPIYFLFTRAGYVCGWCELDKNGEWLTLVPHPLSYAAGERWRYKQIERSLQILSIWTYNRLAIQESWSSTVPSDDELLAQGLLPALLEDRSKAKGPSLIENASSRRRQDRLPLSGNALGARPKALRATA